MASSKKKKQSKQTTPQRKPSLDAVSQKRLITILSVIVALLAIAEYIQTLGYSFALDDYSAIIENSVTRNGIHAIPTIFKTSYRFGYPIQGDELYRPIPKSIFAVLWSLFPNNPLPGHL